MACGGPSCGRCIGCISGFPSCLRVWLKTRCSDDAIAVRSGFKGSNDDLRCSHVARRTRNPHAVIHIEYTPYGISCAREPRTRRPTGGNDIGRRRPAVPHPTTDLTDFCAPVTENFHHSVNNRVPTRRVAIVR